MKLDKTYPSAPDHVEPFDLKADPFEKQNLAEERPEEVSRLTALRELP